MMGMMPRMMAQMMGSMMGGMPGPAGAHPAQARDPEARIAHAFEAMFAGLEPAQRDELAALLRERLDEHIARASAHKRSETGGAKPFGCC